MRCLKVPMRCVRVGTFFVGGWGGLNHAWNYLGVLVLTQITGDVRIARSISAGAYDGFPNFGSPMVAGCGHE